MSLLGYPDSGIRYSELNPHSLFAGIVTVQTAQLGALVNFRSSERSHGYRDSSFVGELERVVDEVVQNLFELLTVSGYPRRRSRVAPG